MSSASEKYRSLVAAYAMLFNDKNEVLLARRANTGYSDGFYDVPAGHLEAGETLREACIRELAEEAGVMATVDDLEFVEVLHRNSMDDRVYVDFFFRVKKWDGEPRIMEPGKCDDMAWFSLNNLPDRIVPATTKVLADLGEQVPYNEIGWKGKLDT
ncbi:NUDIX domain-containing protein [Patescibacteria group bacterium]|jgi:mutator protein MutT|nr:NUDIX domain-containing protein [Patescibacteria group bacterium]